MRIGSVIALCLTVQLAGCDKISFSDGWMKPAEPATAPAAGVPEPTVAAAPPPPEVPAVAIEPCEAVSCHALGEFSAYDLTQVGRKEAGSIVSDGLQGYLLFGPYLAFEAGTYQLVLNGSVDEPGGAVVDVVGQKSELVFAEVPLSRQTGNLANATVVIPQAVSDLEVRVFVTNESRVKIDSVTLRPVN